MLYFSRWKTISIWAVVLLGVLCNRVLSGGLSEASLPWIAIEAPAIDLVVLALLCRLFRRGAA